MHNNKNQAVTEHRAEHRLPIALIIKYKILGAPDELNATEEVVTKNISALGLIFESAKQIPIDTELEIFINLPGAVPNSFGVKGIVVRVERLLFTSDFDIGIKFLDISEAQKEEIRRRIERMDIIKLLEKINNKEISDLHLTVNSPPMVRRYGELSPLGSEPLSDEEIKHMIYSILSEEQKKLFDVNKDLDFAISPSVDSRYRVSIFQQRGKPEVVFRHIMADTKNRQELGLPEVIEGLCFLKDGLVIIGGTTGSGKTTTIATMIDIINRERGVVILSLEKPIEYLHKNKKALVKQREVGTDVLTFATGLKSALKQDPDIIVVGEVLDSDSIETALQAAETGHLVITSLHATDTVQIFDRIISFFPLDQRNFIYARLSHTLKATIVQSLLPHKSGIGRLLATEVCVANTAIKRVIRNGDFTQLYSMIQTGSQYKMHIMQKSIDNLFQKDLISAETYEVYSKNVKISQ